MMTNNIFDFKLFFTEEAFEIIQSHLSNLDTYMTKVGVTQNQKESVLAGIYEYITEYASNYGKNKIAFSSALEIIEEIGSPSEIIQNLDISIVETNQDLNVCPYCHFKNLKNSFYCEHCGREIKSDFNPNINEAEWKRDPIVKKFIYLLQIWVDNPFPISFIYFFIPISIFLSFIILSGNDTFLNIGNSAFDNFFNAFSFILLISTIMGILLSFIFGIAIILGFSDLKTIKQQNERLISKYDNRVVGGLVIVFIAINTFLPSIHASSGYYSIYLLLFRFNIYPRTVVLFIWLVIFIIAIYYFLIYYYKTKKPYEVNITKLKLLDLHSQRFLVSDLVRINIKTLMPVLLFAYLSTIFLPGDIGGINSFFSYFIQNFILSLLIVNGFLIMKLNSWKNLVNFQALNK